MKTDRLKDKVVVIGGGAGGIGCTTAMLLASRGAAIVVASRANSRLVSLQEELRFINPENICIATDLRRHDAWSSLMQTVHQRFQRIDVLINCVGTLIPRSLESFKPEEIEDIVATNLLTVVYGTRAAVRFMKSQGHGTIINVGSLGGIVPMPFESLYSAAKFAVRGFSLSMYQELEGTGIDISLISPGSVRTKMLDLEATDDRSSISFVQSPLDRMKVARAVAHLIEKPKREIILPRITGRLAQVVNLFPALFGISYPALRFLGERNLKKYRQQFCHQANLATTE